MSRLLHSCVGLIITHVIKHISLKSLILAYRLYSLPLTLSADSKLCKFLFTLLRNHLHEILFTAIIDCCCVLESLFTCWLVERFIRKQMILSKHHLVRSCNLYSLWILKHLVRNVIREQAQVSTNHRNWLRCSRMILFKFLVCFWIEFSSWLNLCKFRIFTRISYLIKNIDIYFFFICWVLNYVLRRNANTRLWALHSSEISRTRYH